MSIPKILDVLRRVGSSGPAGAQLPADWNAVTGVTRILNKPDFLAQLNTAFQAGTHTGITVAFNASTGAFSFTASGGGPTAWSSITGKPNFALVATSGDYNDLLNKPATGAGASALSRSIALTVSGKAVTVTVVGLGSAAGIAAVTAAASVDGAGAMVITLANTGGIRLTGVTVHDPLSANGGTGFTLVAPDPSGASSLDASALASIDVYNGTGNVVPATLVAVSISGTSLSVSKTGLTAGTGYRYKVTF